jgi:hypothetical protein
MSDPITRREFVRGMTVAATGAAIGLTPIFTVRAGNPEKADTSKILNYNPEMEYRRCGKTNLMSSCVCLGGHWKRIDMVLSTTPQEPGWMSGKVGNRAFEQNRYDVVTRCIERGINHIDACCEPEVIAYSKALKGRRDKMHLHFSCGRTEIRNPDYRTFAKLKGAFPRTIGRISKSGSRSAPTNWKLSSPPTPPRASW